MTARRPPRGQYVAAVLRIVCEGTVAAYYACQICPYTASARGRAKTAAFVADIRTSHRATCPALQPKGKAA